MKILHVAAAVSWRGGEQQVAYLINELKELGHASMVFCTEGSAMEKYCEKNKLLFQSFILRSGISFSAAFGLKKAVNNFKPDLIHLHDSHAHTFGFMATMFGGVKTPMVLSRRVDFPIGSSFLSRWKYNHDSIKRIICVSGFIENLVKTVVKSSEKVMTIHSGIDLDRFPEKPTGKLRQLLNVKDDVPLIGNVAALAAHKDHLTFVDASALILAQKPNAQFVIIGGDGGEKERIENYIAEKKLSPKITLLGHRDDLPALFSDLDVFMFSSKEEGLGTSVIDALVAGIPVITTAAGGIPEIIEHKKNGWIVPVGDSEGLCVGVCKVLNDSSVGEAWVKVGKETAASFSKKKTARETLTVYDEIISSLVEN